MRDFGVRPLLAGLVFVSSCGEERTSSTVNDPSAYETILDTGGGFVEVESKTQVISESTDMELRPSEQDPDVRENWICKITRYDVTRTPDEFPLFDPNAEIVFPGNLLQGASLQQATPDPIPVARGPGKIVVTLVNGLPEGVSREVDEVSLGSVYDAANEVIGGSVDDTLIPARLQFTMERVHSEQHLAIAADADTSWTWGSFGASMRFSTDREYNRFLVRLNQAFYTVAYELPEQYSQVFGPGASPEALARYIGPGNPAAFISSVTFGRIFYLLIESTERAEAIEASINASFSGVIDVSAHAETKYVNDLSNVRFKAFALGGDAGAALNAVTADFESLRSFLAEGGNIRTGVPISYVVRSLRHPDQIVKVALNTQYDVKDCRPVRETYGVPVIWLMAEPEQLELRSNTNRVLRWKDAGRKGNDAYCDACSVGSAYPDANIPEWVPNAVHGDAPAVRFDNGATFRFHGGELCGSDYTITMVAQFALSPDYRWAFEFLGGATSAEGRMIRAGFLPQDDPQRPADFGWSHSPYPDQGVRTSYAPDPSRFHVYSLVFSQADGMIVSVDGREIAYEPTRIQPLTDFLGARVGDLLGLPDESITIAELIAYDFALSGQQLGFLEDDLMRRYRF